MNDLAIMALLVLSLFLILGSGVWIGLSLSGVAWIGMQLFTARPAGDAMAVTIWGSASSWTLTALPLFVWMGEILFRTRLSQDMFKGLAPWMQALRHRRGVDCQAVHRRCFSGPDAGPAFFGLHRLVGTTKPDANTTGRQQDHTH
jgi:TRAP-type mannitol/chloroaromatic compound transport system permease large subunit